MLAYIVGITKRGNKEITNWGRFYGLQIGAREAANRGSLWYVKAIANWGKSFKLGQGLQVGAKNSFLNC